MRKRLLLSIIFILIAVTIAESATALKHRVSGRIESTAGGFTLPGTTVAGQPAPGDTGTVARVTNDDKSIWMDSGTDWFSLTGKVIDIRAYGADPAAVSPVTNNDAFSNAIAAATAGDAILVPCAATDSIYDVSTAISVSKALTIFSNCGAEIHQTTANTKLITITASNVTISGLKLTGLQYTVETANEQAINILGTSAASPATNIRIIGNKVNFSGLKPWSL